MGERQLVALARAQLADPGLLVLDEATSSVDAETERGLAGALARLSAGRTTVTHRPPAVHGRGGRPGARLRPWAAGRGRHPRRAGRGGRRLCRLYRPGSATPGLRADHDPLSGAGRADQPRLRFAAVAGYSGTPLARKLGIKAGRRWRSCPTPGPPAACSSHCPRASRCSDGLGPADVVWFFTRSRAELVANLDALADAIHPASACWVSWPKKAAARRIPTDLTEDGIREVVLPGGDLVDVKVCAVDDDWSGLKLVWRKERR